MYIYTHTIRSDAEDHAGYNSQPFVLLLLGVGCKKVERKRHIKQLKGTYRVTQYLLKAMRVIAIKVLAAIFFL